jgi:hypothetical protein
VRNDKALAEAQYSQALWYAWGREDAGNTLTGGLLSSTVKGFAFADAYVAAYQAFINEERYYMRSMRGCFELWQNKETF